MPRRSAKNRLRILVVDDYQNMEDTFAPVLTRWGHEVVVCYALQQCQETAESFQPQVAFVRLGMPLVPGDGIARRLTDVDESGTLLLIAVTPTEALGESAIASGFADYLLSPVAEADLAAVLKRASP